MIVWELTWADSALVVLDEWSSYRVGRLSRFDCNIFEKKKKKIVATAFVFYCDAKHSHNLFIVVISKTVQMNSSFLK